MEEQGFYDIYGVCHVPFWQRTWFYWTSVILIGCALCVLVGYLVVIYRRRLHRIQIPYWQKIVDELQELQRQKINTRPEGNRLYTYLTQLLKHYLYQRYQYDLTGKTDAETLQFLEKAHFDQNQLERLRTIFEGGEYIKFAHAQAAAQQIERDLQVSIEFIRSTHQVPQKGL